MEKFFQKVEIIIQLENNFQIGNFKFKISFLMIKVCGYNFNSLGGYPNNPISFPMNSQLDGPSILSYHDCDSNSIIIARNGSLKAIGNNYSGEIYGSLPRQQLTNYTEFQIQDRQGILYSPISALLATTGSFFIVSDPNNSEKNY